MAELKVPVDFERLPEVRSLHAKLAEVPERAAEAPTVSAWMFMRLWVDLAYQATVSKPLGYLPESAVPLFEGGLTERVRALQPIQLLCATGSLRIVPGGYQCDRFAAMNEHLSPDFLPGRMKGTVHSAFVRGKRQMADSSVQQAILLPPETLKRRDGRPLVGSEINRVILLINCLDRCLKLPPRHSSQFTEGVIFDAADVLERYTAAQLESSYFWIIDHRDHPGMPKTTEQVLMNFGALAALVTVGRN
jgi:hypothetical protein